MMFLAMDSGLDLAPEKVERFLHEDLARVWRLQAEGVIRAAYQRGDNPFAVLILECASMEEARATLSTIPFVREGVTQFDTLIELRPFTALEALFRPDALEQGGAA